MSRMDKLGVLAMLQEQGGIVSGHFELLSGLHTETYVRTSVVLQYPHLAQKLARGICALFPQEADVVLTPTMGGLVLGQEVARAKKCRAIFGERGDGALTLKRDFKLQRGERVLVVEDVITTGRHASETVSLAVAYGAKVMGVAAVVDRSTTPLPLSLPVRALVSYPMKLSTPESCQLCSRGAPLVKPGTHRGPERE